MIRLLYINGRLIPEPPTDAVCTYGNNSEVIRLTDGKSHVIPFCSEPLYLCVEFSLYKDKMTFFDTEFRNTSEVISFLKEDMASPFDIVLLFGAVDINITAVATDLSFAQKDDDIQVTLKLREYKTEADA